MWIDLGANLAPFWLYFPSPEASWAPLGAVLARLEGVLGRLGSILGASWEPLGASWEGLGRLLGAFLSHLGRFWELKRDLESILEAMMLICEKHKKTVKYYKNQGSEDEKSCKMCTKVCLESVFLLTYRKVGQEALHLASKEPPRGNLGPPRAASRGCDVLQPASK